MRRFLVSLFAAATVGACGPGREASAPPPEPPPAPVRRPPVASPPILREIQVCVVENGQLREVTAQYNTISGDTSFGVSGWPVMPSGSYAADAPWFLRDEPITVQGRRYVKFSTPRIVEIDDLERRGVYMGVPLFAQKGDPVPLELLFVPVKHGCEFQPYALESAIRGARGR